mmetsp:Transcript_3270/g.4362  ORF Transcript_3270/g.4362 Transcript_3270/m.4362 type:complete len:725 (+) Transcript_3270:102-2276(+)
MVQFAAKLRANKVSKWEEDYIDYESFKRLIKRIAKVLKSQREHAGAGYYSSDGGTDTDDHPPNTSEDETSMLPTAEHQQLLPTSGDGHQRTNHYGTLDDSSVEDFDFDLIGEFDSRIESEAERIQDFYANHLNECKFQIKELQANRVGSRLLGKNSKESQKNMDINERNLQSQRERVKKESIRWALVEVYRRLNQLHSFTILNYTGFVKITKKYDKATGLKRKQELMKKVHKFRSGFCDAPELLEQLGIVESIVADMFYNSNVVQARSELLAKHIVPSSWEMMHTGMRLGIMIVLCLWVLWNAVTEISLFPDSDGIPSEIIQVYRGIGVFLLCFWCWTAAVYFWNTARVNYTYLFEFDPRHQYQLEGLLNKSSSLTIIYLSNILIYYKVRRGEFYGLDKVNANYLPLLMMIIALIIMIFPLQETSEIYLVISRIIAAPKYEVTFYSAFVADIMTSLVRPMVDFSYSFCFYLGGYWRQYFTKAPGEDIERCQDLFWFSRVFIPLVIALPLFFRFLQNIRRYHDTHKRQPHLLNALKYALAYILVLFGAVYPSLQHRDNEKVEQYHRLFPVLWALTFAASTLFTYYWDVYIDWGLGCKGQKMLRQQRMFSKTSFYYFAIVSDLFLRFSWCVTLLPGLSTFFGADYYLTAILSVVEVFRRTIWLLIRVEYEHLYNSQGYRRVEYIPLHFQAPPSDKIQPKNAVIVELSIFVILVLTISGMAFFQEPP